MSQVQHTWVAHSPSPEGSLNLLGGGWGQREHTDDELLELLLSNSCALPRAPAEGWASHRCGRWVPASDVPPPSQKGKLRENLFPQ